MKKYCPKKWWSLDVVALLLQLHLQYTQSYSTSQQNLTFLEAKQVEHKGKFETDQRNRESHLKQKRLLEEEERKEAAKTRKMLADSSQKLADCLQKVTDSSSSANVLKEVDKKFETLSKSLDEKFGLFFNQMQQMMQQQKE
jgi:hypothetical protein